MKNILIIGYGVVGKNIHIRLLKSNLNYINVYVTDKYEDYEAKIPEEKSIDLAFVCVPTPATKDDVCDITEVYNALKENKKYMKTSGIFVIKSTVLPGTTHKFVNEFKFGRVIFSPEYYGGTKYNQEGFNFTILGGEKYWCAEAAQIMQLFVQPDHKFIFTNSTTAELVKYMENSWLATKVAFCSQFYQIADSIGVNYEELRELFLADPRVNPSHTFIFEDHPYWDSHCLNKDVPAIAETYDATFLKEMIKFNKDTKRRYNHD